MLLALSAILSCATTIFAAGSHAGNNPSTNLDLENAVIDEVCKRVVESYAEYYTIPKIHAEITKTEQKRDGELYFVDVSFTKILLASNASELPYIQGMEDAAKTIKDTSLKSEIQRGIDARKLEINDLYIGAEQEETASFCFFFPKASIKATTPECTMLFMSEFGEMDMAAFSPESRESLYEAGKASVSLFPQKQPANRDVSSTKTNPSDATDYDRIDARDYVRTYSCGTCTTSPHSCRNTSYTFFNGADCANFVSQAIHYGGISTETNWEPYTITWINTGFNPEYYGLVEYMADQGFFFETANKYKAFAGSIIYWNQQSHVGMVDANDTVTMTYCAHTSDRKSASFKNWTGATSDTDVKFFVPVWDSYANQYTPQ